MTTINAMSDLSLLDQGLALQAASIGQVYKVVCPRCFGVGRGDGDEQSSGICFRCKGDGTIELTQKRP